MLASHPPIRTLGDSLPSLNPKPQSQNPGHLQNEPISFAHFPSLVPCPSPSSLDVVSMSVPGRFHVGFGRFHVGFCRFRSVFVGFSDQSLPHPARNSISKQILQKNAPQPHSRYFSSPSAHPQPTTNNRPRTSPKQGHGGKSNHQTNPNPPPSPQKRTFSPPRQPLFRQIKPAAPSSLSTQHSLLSTAPPLDIGPAYATIHPDERMN
jgi:hypothetical protein